MYGGFRGIVLGLLLGLVAGCMAQNSVDEHLQKAREYLASGEHAAAVIELKNALQQDADQPQARLLLGQAYFELGDYPEASKELSRASELGAADETVLPPLAQALLARNELTALEALSVAGLSNAARAIVLAAQGWGKLRLGDMDAAALLVEQAVKEDPRSPYALFVRARLLAARAGDDYAPVRAQLDAVFELDPDYAPAWDLLGDVEARDLELARAETAYTRAVAGDPGNFDYRYKRALLRIQMDNFEQARDDVAKLHKLLPKHPGTQYLLGIIASRDGDFTGAVAALERASQYEDQFPLSMFYLAVAQARTGQLEQAEASASRFLAPNPDHAMGRKLLASIKLQMGDSAAAERLLRPVIARDESDVAALNLLASALLRQGKTAQGIDLLSAAAQLQPESPEAQTRLGAGLLLGGEVVEGLEHLSAALQMNPQLQQADLLLISALLREQRYDAALEAIDAFEDKHPGGAAPDVMRGTVYMRSGDRASAEQAFARALTIAPADPAANFSLALLAIRDQDYDRARRYYQNVLNEKENDLPTLLKLAALSELENDYPAMQSRLRQAADAYPKAIQPRIFLARHYLVQGKPDQAQLALSELDKTGKANPEVLNVQGMVQLQRGNYRDARDSFKELIGKRPDAPQPHYHLGLVYRNLGDTERMAAEFEKAIAMAPGYIAARVELTRWLLQNREREAALQQLQILRQLVPDSAEVMQLDAVRARFDGDDAQALTLSEQALHKAPSTRNVLVLARQQWSMGATEDAQRTLTTWLEQHPGDTGARLELAAVYRAQGEKERAMAQYARVLEIDEKSFVALNNLAWELRDSDPAQALAYAKRAVDLDRQSPSALDTLAMVQLKNGNTAAARRSIARALEQKPGDPTARYHSAVISAAAGERDAAIGTLEGLLADHAAFAEREQAEKLMAQLR
ncbi:MAG: PEP-CTERM system TPR-repeat protein PrsT [Halioglobus sp.]|nr:PEP-CTERM system TPR-repeat protein PrsT [Halioglobus sp.]